MTPDTTVSIALIVSVVSIISMLAGMLNSGRKRQEEHQEAEKNRQLDIEKNFVKINVKLDEFSNDTKKMIIENTKKTEELKNVSEKLVVISEKVNTLFKYKDDHEERIKGLENKVK